MQVATRKHMSSYAKSCYNFGHKDRPELPNA
jgi:hypothetical protein